MQLYRPRHKTAHRALHGCFLRLHPLNRPRYQTDTSGYNTTCATLEGIPAPGSPQPIPDTTATPGRCTGQHRQSIIIRYIRGQTMPAAAGQLLPSADCWQVLHPAHPLRGQPGGLQSGTRSAVRAGILAPSTRRGSPAARARRAARNHWRLPPHLFSGFRPIANRGQQ